MEQRKWKLDSWDALVKETTNSLQPPSYLREMDQRCPRDNRLAHNTVAKFQASLTWDPWDEPSAHSEKAPA